MQLTRSAMRLPGALLFAALSLFGFQSQAAGETVEYQAEGKRFTGYYNRPAREASGEAPLVIIVHDWDGLTEYEKRRADMLTEEGYSAFAVDLFGDEVRPETLDEKRAETSRLYDNRASMRNIMLAAVAAADRAGARIRDAVLMGYCFGGAVTLEMARAGLLMKGFVSFHGSFSTPEDADFSKISAPLLILHGSADKVVSFSELTGLAQALENEKVPNEIASYGGAPHGFTVFGTEAYREQADHASWRRFGEFLASSLGFRSFSEP